VEELQERFSLERVSKSPAVFDEKKLRHMNGTYIRQLDVEELTRRLEAFTGRSGLGEAVAISREKFQTLAEFWPLVGFLFDGPADDPKLREKWLAPEATQAVLGEARRALEAIEGPWTVEDVEAALTGVVEREGVKPGKLFQPIRVALAGTTVSPGIFETVAVLGRDETLARLQDAMSALNRPSTVADRG
jgi:glutamyl/glutaminyl-tRNA synthetase